jgi:hypothetical protein
VILKATGLCAEVLSLLSRSVGSPQTIDGVIVETALIPTGNRWLF